MSSSNLIRWSGAALVLAGVLIAGPVLFHPDEVAHPEAVTSATWFVVHVLFAAGAVLALFGLTGLYARQAERVGKTGLVGFVLAFIGVTLLVSALVIEAFVVSVISSEAPRLLDASGPLFAGPLGVFFLLAGVSFALGAVLLGAATVRAGVLPRFSAPPLIVGAPLLAFWPPLPHLAGVTGGVLVGIGFAWMGYAVWASERVPQPQVDRGEPARA